MPARPGGGNAEQGLNTIGKYRVTRPIGEGATSTVYLCHDDFADRDVAVKVVHLDRLPEGKERVFRSLLLAEASLAGKLVHPHIVQIFDAVLEERMGYIAMEYVAGGTLEAYIDRAALLDPKQVVRIGYKCARALEYAARQGVIHRDIKPANILVAEAQDDEIEIKLSDFGSALHALADQTFVTGIGSPAYMSPEQVRDEDITHQTDIYSLGVVLYQLLAGQLPFHAGNSYGLMYQIAHGEPTSLGAVRPDLPAALGQVVHRMMERERTRRYADWAELSGDLASLFDDVTMRSNEVGATEKFTLLRSLPFFREFPDAQLWEALRFTSWQELEAGRRVIVDGTEGDFFCILAAGEVKVTKRGKLLNVLRAGDCFGEMSYLQPELGNSRTADVTTTEPALVVIVHTPDLRRASDACQHRFDQAFMRVLVDRLDLANRRLATA